MTAYLEPKINEINPMVKKIKVIELFLSCCSSINVCVFLFAFITYKK